MYADDVKLYAVLSVPMIPFFCSNLWIRFRCGLQIGNFLFQWTNVFVCVLVELNECISYVIGGLPLTQVEETQYLVVISDSTLSFNYVLLPNKKSFYFLNV